MVEELADEMFICRSPICIRMGKGDDAGGLDFFRQCHQFFHCLWWFPAIRFEQRLVIIEHQCFLFGWQTVELVANLAQVERPGHKGFCPPLNCGEIIKRNQLAGLGQFVGK